MSGTCLPSRMLELARVKLVNTCYVILAWQARGLWGVFFFGDRPRVSARLLQGTGGFACRNQNVVERSRGAGRELTACGGAPVKRHCHLRIREPPSPTPILKVSTTRPHPWPRKPVCIARPHKSAVHTAKKRNRKGAPPRHHRNFWC
jgi:hypothetical protein